MAGSKYPDQESSNFIIAAHSGSGWNAFFTKLDRLKYGNMAYVTYNGKEYSYKLNRIYSDSKGDGIKDGERELIYTVKNDHLNISIEITGKGNIASTTIDELTNSTFKDKDGLLDKVYNFYTDGTVKNAIVTIKYDEGEIAAQGLNEQNLTLYYFNEETKE